MINWSLFPKAIQLYHELGYKYIEVPWIVNRESIDVTIPEGNIPFKIEKHSLNPNRYLVGSAEQSFIQLALSNELQPRKYMALTPCFRNDPLDDIHHEYFMKLELFDLFNVPTNTYYRDVLHDARHVLQTLSQCFLTIQPTDIGTDLTYNNIELGSYGARSYKNISWTYGTGLAEPRFSYVMNSK